MTVDEYYAIVRWMKLTRTNVPGVYLGADGDHHTVPNPDGHTAAQRKETLERLATMLGITEPWPTPAELEKSVSPPKG